MTGARTRRLEVRLAVRRLDDFVFGRLKNQYPRLLRVATSGCETLLDVGCGSESPIRSFSQQMTRTVGVDLDRPSIEQSQANGTHHEYIVMDVMDIGRVFSERSFDAVLASDLIEHLPKADGNRLIEMMEGIAAKRVIIFTPNGFVPQNADDHNQHQVHLSGWTADEMRMRGYDVISVNGLKQLLNELAHGRWKPRLVWRT